MGLETGTYPSFIGGVSQQDDTVRSPNQVTDSVNSWNHAALGAGKRPPASFVQILGHDVDPMAHYHSIVRDDHERYIVVVGHRSIRVFDHETGHEYDVVVTGDALDYLDTHGLQGWSVFKTTTVADATFVVNRNTVVKMGTSVTPGFIAGDVMTLQDLPKGDKAKLVPTGALYRIGGSSTNPFDDYYVIKEGPNTWVECAKPGIAKTFDRSTMPHVLKRIPDEIHGDGMYFSFGAPLWDERATGDETSNPEPSFVGSTIQEVFSHRNRLGLLSTENVVLSCTDAYFNFWRTSVTQLLDTDPVDVAVPTNGVAALWHAVSFQSAVYLAGSDRQFLLSAEPFMSPRNVKTDPALAYAISRYIRPQMMGDSMYFIDDAGGHAVLREYFMDDLGVTGDAADVTAHVPRFIPGRVRALACVTSGDAVLVAVDDPDGYQVYTYSVRWAGDEKVQSAWSRWKIEGVGKVVHMHAIGDIAYLVAEAPGGGVELLKVAMTLNQADSDAAADYTFMLDRLAVLAPTYQALGNFTNITLPYILDTLDGVTVIKTDDWADPGAYLSTQGATLEDGGQTIRLPGRHDTGRLAVGLDYEHKMVLTKPLMRQRDGTAVLVGRSQVRDLEVAYKDAAFFEVAVEAKGRSRVTPFVTGYTSRQLGDADFRLSSPVFNSGSSRFPILSNADHVSIALVNRLPYQCWFQSAQWRGLFVSRSRV